MRSTTPIKESDLRNPRRPIHIKEENKGKFTAYAKLRGESVQQAASHVLNTAGEPAYLRKRANFAKNFAH